MEESNRDKKESDRMRKITEQRLAEKRASQKDEETAKKLWVR